MNIPETQFPYQWHLNMCPRPNLSIVALRAFGEVGFLKQVGLSEFSHSLDPERTPSLYETLVVSARPFEDVHFEDHY